MGRVLCREIEVECIGLWNLIKGPFVGAMGILKDPIIDPYVTTWGHILGPRCGATGGATSWVKYVTSWVNVMVKV